jgi:hypothetical protein
MIITITITITITIARMSYPSPPQMAATAAELAAF